MEKSEERDWMQCILMRDGKRVDGLQMVELVSIDGVPHAYFEQPGTDQGFAVPLDPTRLHPFPGGIRGDWMYELPVEDPRQLS